MDSIIDKQLHTYIHRIAKFNSKEISDRRNKILAAIPSTKNYP